MAEELTGEDKHSTPLSDDQQTLNSTKWTTGLGRIQKFANLFRIVYSRPLADIHDRPDSIQAEPHPGAMSEGPHSVPE